MTSRVGSIALATVVACHGGSTPSPDAATVMYGSPVACGSALSCGPTNANDPCDLTVDAALHDAGLCTAFYSTCADDWTIVDQMGVDTGVEYLYQHGQLVAVMHFSAVFGRECFEGPPSFAPPGCDATAVKIPACP